MSTDNYFIAHTNRFVLTFDVRNKHEHHVTRPTRSMDLRILTRVAQSTYASLTKHLTCALG